MHLWGRQYVRDDSMETAADAGGCRFGQHGSEKDCEKQTNHKEKDVEVE